jgi:hypothetical protein
VGEREITIVRTRKKISLSLSKVRGRGNFQKVNGEERENERTFQNGTPRASAREREREKERKREKRNHRLVRANARSSKREREREDKSAHFFYYRRETHPFYNHVRALFIFLLKSERRVFGGKRKFSKP